MHRCVKPFFHPLTSSIPLSICAAPSRGAAAEEGKDALCAIDVGPSFDPSKENGIDAADLAAVEAALGWDDDADEVDRGVWVGGGGGVWGGCGGGDGGGGGGDGGWLNSLPVTAPEDPERLGGGLADIGGSVVGGEDEDEGNGQSRHWGLQ